MSGPAAPPSLAQLLRDPPMALAFGFGLGLTPKAPGTAGTLLGVGLHFLLVDLPVPVRAGIVLALFVLGTWVCDIAARRLGVHDHQGIVFDEVVGYLIAMLAAPAGWLWALAGFALFRLFDIWKPWPIRLADQRVKGGFGIMLDDALAGALAAVILSFA